MTIRITHEICYYGHEGLMTEEVFFETEIDDWDEVLGLLKNDDGDWFKILKIEVLNG